MPQAKNPPAPSFQSVTPPARKRRTGNTVSDETANDLMVALQEASTTDDPWIGDGIAYQTTGKAQSGARRLRQALVTYEYVESVKDIKTRVWSDNSDKGPFYIALRLADES